MKRNLLYTAVLLLIVAQGAWAIDNYYPTTLSPTPSEGPWTFVSVTNEAGYRHDGATQHYDAMDHTAWKPADADIISQFKDAKTGLGFKMICRSEFEGVFGVFSIYRHREYDVEPYTRKQLKWNFTLHGYTSTFVQNVALYACNNLDTLRKAVVNFTAYSAGTADSPYYLANLQTNNDDHSPKAEKATGVLYHEFDFDNRSSDTTRTIDGFIMLTHVIENDINSLDPPTYTQYCAQTASFKHQGYTWETFYYKHITFEANGGEGAMSEQEIENTQNLTANAFTRSGYAFAGWATTPNGFVVYADGAPITAAIDNKGLDTLYAQWVPAPTAVIALIDAIGTVTYPDSKAAIDAARDAYDALDEEVKPYVSNYGKLLAAEDSYAVSKATALIEAIGTVERTAASKALIDAARAAYDALTLAEKTMVNNYSTLIGAEADFVELTKSSFVFMDKDAEPVGDSQRKSIDYPALPAGATEWQSVEKDVTDKTIVIKAVE